MICLGKIRNSLTFVEYLRILGISGLTNLRSPIREFFRVLIVYGKQSSDYYEMVDIRLTGRGMAQI